MMLLHFTLIGQAVCEDPGEIKIICHQCKNIQYTESLYFTFTLLNLADALNHCVLFDWLVATVQYKHVKNQWKLLKKYLLKSKVLDNKHPTSPRTSGSVLHFNSGSRTPANYTKTSQKSDIFSLLVITLLTVLRSTPCSILHSRVAEEFRDSGSVECRSPVSLKPFILKNFIKCSFKLVCVL